MLLVHTRGGPERLTGMGASSSWADLRTGNAVEDGRDIGDRVFTGISGEGARGNVEDAGELSDNVENSESGVVRISEEKEVAGDVMAAEMASPDRGLRESGLCPSITSLHSNADLNAIIPKLHTASCLSLMRFPLGSLMASSENASLQASSDRANHRSNESSIQPIKEVRT